MELLIILIFAVVMMAVLFGRKLRYKPPQSTMPDPGIFRHYAAQDSLFANRSELAFFHTLSRALPRGYHVLIKPRLEDVIGVRKDLSNPKLAFQLRGRVKSRHVDYVIIDDEGRPLCGIELDGGSHNSAEAIPGDTLKNGIFRAAGLTLHRVRVGEDFANAARIIANELSNKSQTNRRS